MKKDLTNRKQLTTPQCLEVIDYLDSLGFKLDNADKATLEALMTRSFKIQGESFVDKFINYKRNHDWYKSVKATTNELMYKVYGHYYVNMLTDGRKPLSPEELIIPASLENTGKTTESEEIDTQEEFGNDKDAQVENIVEDTQVDEDQRDIK